ncbi:MAG: preprotein translocase subunit SecA [Oscillospiraceae bacterium]|nr:preprotein translocase subunit SecA [Oscillospiraceae bacterium]
MGLITKIFGTRSQRELKRIQPMVDSILALEETYAALSEEELKGKTAELKERLAQGETLDDILVDAFAAVREAAWRVLGMKPYPVQLIGGIILHQGRIAEMKTGEGKTLVAILPCYLNALTGRGVHVVTVNDYLAKRDSEWMGKVYRYMGLSVGLIIPGMTPAERRVSYAADITYCTNNELGFDYLRDNMSIYQSELVQRGHAFAIVDEVDSILIDEARTPLIISGKGEESSQLYQMADNFVSGLRKKVFAKTEDKEVHDDYDCDYFVDEKSRSVSLTATGIAKAEKFFGVENLADSENTTLSHHINQAMKARGLMKKDIDYVVKEGQIIIVDEFTGRLMYGRRYNEGLHQAIEAKEKVTVAGESKTLATITFQNFFRLYDKLSGMTGTALTEEEEFATIYKLDVVEIPTNRPVARVDRTDVVYKTEVAKFRAIIQQVKECHAKGQPVLVGTISIERSELLSKLLKREGIPHNVLNAKYHEMEAQIVAQAGKFGAVTIATNMAGRGTDIVLGGNAEFLAKTELRKADLPEELLAEADSFAETQDPEILAIREKYEQLLQKYKAEIADEAEKVRQAGGLFIIGTERHESRRIDNQLRGRSGRQGDPGESRFYLSMQDDLMRLFASDRISAMMDFLRIDEDMPIDAKILSGAVENAQKAVESRHFRSRKSVLEFDDVMNTQRGIIYAQRQKVLSGEDLRDNMLSMLREVILGAEEEELTRFEGIFYPVGSVAQNPDPDALCELAEQTYERKEADLTPSVMREAERVIMLRVVDEYWMDHIDAMDDLKQGIGLRAYGQHDPVIAYKEEGFAMFEAMVTAIREETVRRLMLVQIRPQQELRRQRVAKETGTAAASETTVKKVPVRNKDKKVGPNDPCPCGSGKKYKKCCMQKEKLQ